MSIKWYPGHMVTARAKAAETIRKTDLVIEGRAAYDDEDVATTLGQYLLRHYPELLAQRFGAPPAGCDGHGLLEFIATSRSLVKGGGPDVARAAVALLNDFRSGTLGRITLETVEQAAEPAAELAP